MSCQERRKYLYSLLLAEYTAKAVFESAAIVLEPAQAALSLNSQKCFAWLDANLNAHPQGRYSYLAAEPEDILCVGHGQAKPFDALRDIQRHPGFWIGYINYDAAFEADATLRAVHARDERLPLLFFARYPALYCFDHHQKQGWILAQDKQAAQRFEALLNNPTSTITPCTIADIQVDVDSKEAHTAAIEQALEHIRQGNIYQANLARRWRCQFKAKPLSLFLRMREQSPVPYGFFLAQQNFAVLGRSMECFFDWQGPGKRLFSKPIKGTIKESTDANLRSHTQLYDDPKERAEHTMIVDLMRNDLSKVAQPRSVKVTEPYAIEAYTGLSHMVSTVECISRDDLGICEIMQSLFPPGSVTGTPKHRAMQLIEELEPASRALSQAPPASFSLMAALSSR
ncbi:MAG: anthranilate synthase component I family protein [Myxococcales bacterium]|nr:MAG: anthranilate synthase component I family protein [Myxococcales bacterium]